MEASRHLRIHSLNDTNSVVTELKRSQNTGMLVILSHEAPTGIRWALQAFFLHGKLVKTEHTLESTVLLTEDGTIEAQQDGFVPHTLNAQYTLNPPQQLFFFPLYERTVRREMSVHPLQMADE